jgi:haloacetate dehalogenase
VLWGLQGVVQRLFDPMALWQAQCSGPLSGRAMACGHFIPEALPDETATELLAFHG